jgi:hypothetical protein
MRTRWLWALFALLLLPLWGCEEDDGYSLGDYWITTATIEKGDVSPYIIVTDNGTRLFPSATAIPWFETRDQQRVWINYTILGDATGEFDHYVKVNNLAEILTKGVLQLTPENADSIGNDPVRINNYWFAGDFLTIQFAYGGGETIHYINLVQDVDNPVDEQGRPILLFRHNRNDDPANYELFGTVSINLYDFRVEGQTSVSFVLKSTPFAGEDPVDVVLEYNYGTGEVQQVIRAVPRNDAALIK